MGSNMSSIIEVVQLFYTRHLLTVGSSSLSYIDIDNDTVRSFGPYLAGMTLMISTENRTTNHNYKIVYYWSLDGRQWSNPVDLCSVISASGDVIQVEVTDQTKFGLHIRFAIAQANASGTNIERAVSSAWLVLRFKN